jgi:HlyD family secretion protein
MDTPTNVKSAEVERTLSEIEPAKAPPWRKALPWAIGALAVLLVAYLWLGRTNSGSVEYVTQPVTRGALTVTVTATGNLEPVNQVDIGVELSGTVRLVNVDFNDEVKKGQVLATLDTERLKAQVLQSQSALASAEARVRQASAAAKEARANYQRLLKVRELSGNKLPSQQDLDVADAAVANAEGERAAAEAAVAQARASLSSVQTDLGKADIRSPIDGVVLVRSVEPDRRRFVAGPGAVHAGRRPQEDGAARHGRRSRRRFGRGRPAGDVLGRRVPDPDVLGAHHAGALRIEQHAEIVVELAVELAVERDLDGRRDI